MANDLIVALSVDALTPQLTGIGRYCLELADRLPAAIGNGRLHCFRGRHWIENPRDLTRENWAPKREPVWRRSYDRWRRHKALGDAVVHAPNYFLPPWAERGVATIHDLSVLLYPETHPVARVQAFETKFAKTLDQARLLVTDTYAVREELMTMFGIAPERIKAVPLGVSQMATAPNLAILSEFGLQGGLYILCVSTFEPRKRIDRLVRAFGDLPLSFRQRHPLVLAGAAGWRSDALDGLIAEAARDGTVRRLGFVPEDVLGTLYAGAGLFVYPSRYEGFGLPVVEAMAHGVPCVIADTTCLIEVAQGAARVVDPESIDDFADAIRNAFEDDPWRHDAARAGKAVARGYTWDACVSAMVEAYRSI